MSISTLVFASTLFIIVVATIITIEYGRVRNREFMSFRESIGLVDLPIVTFYQGETKLNFLLDTGANLSIIDEKVVNSIETQVSETISTTIGIGKRINNITNVDIKFLYKNKEFTDTFQVVDMSEAFGVIKKCSGVTMHGIIGNNFMQRYKYVLDFKEMIAYSQK